MVRQSSPKANGEDTRVGKGKWCARIRIYTQFVICQARIDKQMDGWRLHFTPIKVVYADRVIVNRIPCRIPSNNSFLWIGLKVQFEHASVIFSFPNHL